MSGLAFRNALCALCVVLGSDAPQALANEPKPRVAFRVDRNQEGLTFLKPIYPAKLGAKQIQGEEPKRGELLTCYISTRKIVKLRDKEGDFEVTMMKLECLNGSEFEVVGIEY